MQTDRNNSFSFSNSIPLSPVPNLITYSLLSPNKMLLTDFTKEWHIDLIFNDFPSNLIKYNYPFILAPSGIYKLLPEEKAISRISDNPFSYTLTAYPFSEHKIIFFYTGDKLYISQNVSNTGLVDLDIPNWARIIDLDYYNKKLFIILETGEVQYRELY